MDEITVRLARAIASPPRLRLLACPARRGEVNPNALAETLRMPVNTLSGHLRVLLTAGLVLRRKSGAWRHFRRIFLPCPTGGVAVSSWYD